MQGQYFLWLIGMFGWEDFRADGKKKKENGRENIFCGRLVGGRKGENIGGAQVFSPEPTKMFSIGWGF